MGGSQEATSFKVEPVHIHPSNWNGDAASAPMVSQPLPPPPPRDAFLPLETSESHSDLPMVKIGPPLKSSLKWPKSRTRVMQDDAKPMDRNEVESGATQLIEKRSIMWQDNHGKKLAEVKVFEPRYFHSFPYVALWLLLVVHDASVYISILKSFWSYIKALWFNIYMHSDEKKNSLIIVIALQNHLLCCV